MAREEGYEHGYGEGFENGRTKATRRAMKRDTRKAEKMGVWRLLKRGTERDDAKKSLRRDPVLSIAEFHCCLSRGAMKKKEAWTKAKWRGQEYYVRGKAKLRDCHPDMSGVQ